MNPSNCIRGNSRLSRATHFRPGQGRGGFPKAPTTLIRREIPRGVLKCTPSRHLCSAWATARRISGRVGLI